MRLLVLAAVVGCAGPRAGAPPVPSVPKPSNEVPSSPLPRGEGDVLLRGAADLDGDGREDDISVEGTGFVLGEPYPRIPVAIDECASRGDLGCLVTLRVGNASVEIPVTAPDAGFGGFGVEIVDIDPMDQRRELLVTQRGGDGEDPWYEFRVVVYDGRALHVSELWHSNGYNSGTARAGGGALVLEYDECPDRTTVLYRLDGPRLVETDRKVERVRAPDTCAACPFVYVLEGHEFEKRGEILRYLHRKDLEQTQTLPLGPVDGTVVVELREEKDEVTFLDDIWLDVDGTRIDPLDVAFAADGHYHVLRKGDVLRLTFEAPAGTARLVATGYYEPLLTPSQ